MDDFKAKFLKKILKTRKAEALQWLLAETSSSMRVLGELAQPQSLALVRRIYEVGAAKVLAVDIREWQRGEHSSHIVIELPTDLAARRSIFELANKMSAVEGYDGAADQGQDRLFVKVKSDEVIAHVFGDDNRLER